MPSFQRSTLVPYALAAVLVLVLGGRWIATRHAAAPPAAAVPSFASGSSAGSDSASSSTTPASVTLGPAQNSVVVDVAGAVRRPGVYRMGPGSRVRDALAHAGGPTSRANTAAVNRAAKLADGQQIIVPERVSVTASGTAGAPAPSATTPAAPVSLNAATLEQLDGLPGVGPSTAQKIVDWRTQHGGFASVDDLGEIPGIGPKKLEALRPKVSA